MCPVLSASITVNSGDNLSTKIGSAVAGDVVLINAGTYGALSLSGKAGTAAKPFVIRKNGTGTVTIRNSSISGGRALQLTNCSYMVFEGVEMRGGMWGITMDGCNHVIVNNCVIDSTGQEGCHFFNSSYVDIIGTQIHHTGRYNAQWGEGIYISTGSYSGVTFPNLCENFWIEGCEIWETGNGEAINVKSEAFHVTIRGNTIHNIHPGTASQWNGGAISVDGAGNSISNNYRLTESRDIWIESNLVTSVLDGTNPNGIQASAIGVNIKNNTISGCTKYGIWSNTPGPLSGFPSRIYQNTISGCATAIGGNQAYVTTNPGANPNVRQLWYNNATSIRKPVPSSAVIRQLPSHDTNLYGIDGRAITSIRKAHEIQVWHSAVGSTAYIRTL
jgi:hypothetical protein